MLVHRHMRITVPDTYQNILGSQVAEMQISFLHNDSQTTDLRDWTNYIHQIQSNKPLQQL